MLDVTIGSTQQMQGLTLFPLLAPGGASLPYQLLVDAVAAGTLVIGEVGQGTVPMLLAKNTGETDVLVLDGEQLIGSRQNRTTNRSMLLPAHSTTELPVYCMEHGRWHFESEVMAPAPQHSPSKVRRRAREVEAARAGLGPVLMASLGEAQASVWNDVAETVSRLGGRSATGDLSAAYGANRTRLDDWVKAFPRASSSASISSAVTGSTHGCTSACCAATSWTRSSARTTSANQAHRCRPRPPSPRSPRRTTWMPCGRPSGWRHLPRARDATAFCAGR
jgi:hypothetical protein